MVYKYVLKLGGIQILLLILSIYIRNFPLQPVRPIKWDSSF